MKKIRIFIYSMFTFLLLSAGTYSHAQLSDFEKNLLNMNIPINSILSNTGINRYELTRLLNAVECKDCLVPSKEYLNKYTNLFWQKFIKEPGRDFDDVFYKKAIYNKKNYYYCVAYVWDRTYMRWYPKETSPVCAWQFCWERSTTKAEFLQVIMNIIAKYLYPIYGLNRNDAQDRISGLRSRSYQYKTFTKDDLDIITKRAKDCWKQVCPLQNANELNIYLKYCMFNLKECWMIAFDKTKEWYWPVAELNLLYRQQIITLNDAIKYNINQFVDWKLAIETLGKINSLIWCSFDDDYDCDGIPNYEDNCPISYNPQQKDSDGDWVWDVCDDDIDDDGIKNPIWIIDENNNINIALLTPETDNCLFVPNKDQVDLNKNWIGDACETTSPKLSLSIAIQKMEWMLPKTVTFGALSKWPVSSLNRDFGDGTIWSWSQISHTYFTPWLYTVRLFAKWNKANDAYAKTTVIIGRNPEEKQGLYPINTSLIWSIWWEWSFSLSALGKHDSYQRSIWEIETMTQYPVLKKKFTIPGTQQITIKAKNKWNIVAATMFSFGVGDYAYWSMLIPSNIIPEKYETVNFETKLSNFSISSISRIFWDFGDWDKLETTETKVSHDYQTIGKKIVLQTILLNDWTKLQNMITLFVSSNNLFASYWLQILPSSLDLSTTQPFTFKILPLGESFADLIFTNIIAWDWVSNIFNLKNRIIFPLEYKHTYQNPWIYYPQTNVSLDICSQLSAQATLAVGWTDFCMQAKLDWTLSKYICDMDKDWIPDICDADIDGDGMPNLLWLINPSNYNNCNYSEILKNPNQKLINTETLKTHLNSVCSLDNAPFVPNSDQLDLNKNWIGDVMENFFDKDSIDWLKPIIDSDWDWIPDKDDLCPLIPETWNGVSDYDWCPEIWLELYCDNNRTPVWIPSILEPDIYPEDNDITPWLGSNCWNGEQDPWENCFNCPEDMDNCLFASTAPCLQCPCPFIDVNTNLTNKDIVKSVLRDYQKKYPRGYSINFPIFY